ncbi:adenylate cyclase type 10-like [Gallus gallus]|uniref:adenylate cyclase type 10-like n=1 Tax=Gallus gallus TaxID=9031 RepID=UPI001F015ECF|nr:adenylate cyclase type 10-like [Gallus gallus]
MGSTSQALYYVLECAAAYLHVSNSYMALMKLSEAEALRSSVKKERNAIDRFEEAIFFSLKGEVCSNVGCVKLAKEMSRQALRLLEKRRKKQAWLVQRSRCLSLLEDLYSQEGTSGGQRFSRLAALMKANTDSKMHSYQAADSHIGQALN